MSVLRRGISPDRLTPVEALAPLRVPLPPRRYVVWRFYDGKRGHDNQSRGLINALGERISIDLHSFPSTALRHPWQAWCAGRSALGKDLPAPDLIVGAGHGTHLPMLAARRTHGGRVIVLMRPTFPRTLFDLCLIPQHDGVAPSPKVLVTRGVLNIMQSSTVKEHLNGLILLGGSSPHYAWSDDAMCRQIATILHRESDWRWTAVTSRRTPRSFEQALQALNSPQLRVVHHDDTAEQWLPKRLAHAARAWVSEDSVSMVYEALTAGAAVGLLEVPRIKESRVSRGFDALVHDGMLVRFKDWCSGTPLSRQDAIFHEAARCAEWICSTWLPTVQGTLT